MDLVFLCVMWSSRNGSILVCVNDDSGSDEWRGESGMAICMTSYMTG